ncbi:MAG: LysM peptidoglycan-binding domain-containing protein [Prevotella sp.]|nr:LysM peptidoglycan-binding domain-containing protein [Prevotella sp.]
MTRLLRYFLLLTLLFVTVGIVSAQESENIRGLHKVKRKETIFGISKMYDLTIDELLDANPEMKAPDYELKKGTILKIPFSAKDNPVAAPSKPAQSAPDEKMGTSSRPIRVGVMLPLHDIDGDGRRMVEYYRGVLMACDSVKRLGISVDVHAWNMAEDANMHQILADKAAAKCDVIFGPLYSKQMEIMSTFCSEYNIQLVIPFSINAPQLATNRHIFQIWQSSDDINNETIAHFMTWFKDVHPVFIDCNDSTSRKGGFTQGLRRKLEEKKIVYSITNLKSSEEYFSKAFVRGKQNVVILNTQRMQELGVAFSKINGLKVTDPDLNITMFGYTEWLTYTRTYLENFYQYDTYIPSAFYYNPLSPSTMRLQQAFRMNFRTDMQNVQPRFALTGFDQAYFFLRGLHKYGKTFNGARGMLGYTPVQTPLQFVRQGDGGQKNKMVMFVHYTPDHRVETIRF